MTGKRTRYSAEFKAKVALDALRGELTTAQLAAKTAVFSGKAAAQESGKAAGADVEKLHAKIGQLLVERDFLARASGRGAWTVPHPTVWTIGSVMLRA